MADLFDLNNATDLDTQKLPIQTVNGVKPDSKGNIAITSVANATNATNATNANHATTADTANRAYPRNAGGGDINFHWEGRDGQPTWLWGGEDGTNMYVYNPSAFVVHYANGANNAINADNLRTTSYADHFVKVVLDDDDSYFHIFVTAPDGGFRPVRVVRADSAGSADNLGGYPASKYVRSVNGMNADNNGNVNINFGATVVQSYVNNSGWYRLWSDGWLEQGYIVIPNDTYVTVTFLKAFANTNYTIQATPEDIDGNAIPQISNYVNKTVTSVQVCNLVNTNWNHAPVSVYTCGMGA